MFHTRRLLLELQVCLNIFTSFGHLILLYLLDLFFDRFFNLHDIVHELIKSDNKYEKDRYDLTHTGLMMEVDDA